MKLDTRGLTILTIISLTVIAAGEFERTQARTYGYEARMRAYQAYMRGEIGENDFMMVEKQNHSLKFTPRFNAKLLENQGEENFISMMRTIFIPKPDVELKYEAGETQLKEEIIVNRPNGIRRYDFEITPDDDTEISLDGKTPWKGETTITGGEIYLIRKKTPGRIYLTNTVFKILKPFANDTNGNHINLNYTLYKKKDETHLTINIPQQYLDNAKYPITIDPTISFEDSSGNAFRMQNCDDCNTDGCDTIFEHSDKIKFWVQGGCSQSSLYCVMKDQFQFDITDLKNSLSEGAVITNAILHIEGSCENRHMFTANPVLLYNVTPYNPSIHSCSNNPFNSKTEVETIDSEGATSGVCIDGQDNFFILPQLNAALQNNQDKLAFMLDFHDTLGPNEDPFNNYGTQTFKVELDDGAQNVYIDYSLECEHSSQCPTNTYCHKDGYCTEKQEIGAICDDREINLNDDKVCLSGNCAFDKIDGHGHYCAQPGGCTHDHNSYPDGYKKCDETDPFYRTCENTIWSAPNHCDNGCTDSTGCNQPPTTTSTTTILPQPKPNLKITGLEIKVLP